MPSRAQRQTIRTFAQDYFVRVNYVDIYGRNVGFDYEFILAEIKKTFPNAKTSKRWLRKMAYELTGSVRMPMRRRSRRALAEDYAMAMLMKAPAISYKAVGERVRRKFPEHVPGSERLRSLERHMRFLKFDVPVR